MNALEQLRDIHLPPPPASESFDGGWWLALLILLGLGWLLLRHRRRPQLSLKQQARRELTALRQAHDRHGDAMATLRALSAFAHRVALAQAGEPGQVARLTGAAWLQHLDRQLGDNAFSQGPGRILARGPYQAHCDYDVEALFQLMQRWLEHLP